MLNKLSVQVADMQPGDQVLGLRVVSVRSGDRFTRVELDNHASLLLESQGDITVKRDPGVLKVKKESEE